MEKKFPTETKIRKFLKSNDNFINISSVRNKLECLTAFTKN